jgi:hypothetical protein
MHTIFGHAPFVFLFVIPFLTVVAAVLAALGEPKR